MSTSITNYLPAEVNILPIPDFASELQLKIITIVSDALASARMFKMEFQSGARNKVVALHFKD